MLCMSFCLVERFCNYFKSLVVFASLIISICQSFGVFLLFCKSFSLFLLFASLYLFLVFLHFSLVCFFHVEVESLLVWFFILQNFFYYLD